MNKELTEKLETKEQSISQHQNKISIHNQKIAELTANINLITVEYATSNG
ncbi:MAG: hypothetical protein FWH59_01795 [Lentimicrobiaceae bacterium]|nr:hypothetical protein [Lentimicrobiaceae bacterium]